MSEDEYIFSYTLGFRTEPQPPRDTKAEEYAKVLINWRLDELFDFMSPISFIYIACDNTASELFNLSNYLLNDILLQCLPILIPLFASAYLTKKD